jgi:hypothetical protein
MTTAIMTAMVAAGFWTTGHNQYFRYPDLETCERARPVVEAEMVAHGYSGISTVCKAATEGGT